MNDFEVFYLFDEGLFERGNQRRRFNNLIDRRILKCDPLTMFEDEQFRRRFRMSKDTAKMFCGFIEDRINWLSKRNDPTPTIIQFLSTVRVLATGTFQEVDGDL